MRILTFNGIYRFENANGPMEARLNGGQHQQPAA